MATSPLPLTRVLGTIGKFDSTVEHISTYLERLQLYFDANKVKDGCKVPILLTVIGARTYDMLLSILAPAAPLDKMLDALIEMLMGLYDPKLFVIGEKFQVY